ncbi:MAG: tetratricopeptide repeat protein [Candidatus Koribacter versatilis]|uniref:Tetratricopeptide repeat protein n=1 Tax=Candidatus Korobacter versatilis TaxID=658062 RepID=A0A932A871_9BACT|nr:tetratricopeptide repeat protein [Candidatus Koribacter versatilis]
MKILWPAVRVAAAVLSICGVVLALDPVKTVPPDPVALMEAGHYKKARAIVDARFRANPNDAESLYLEARVKNAFGAPEEALKLAERALELNKKNVNYHGALAQLYGDKAQQANFLEQVVFARKVKGHLEEAVALDPKNWKSRDGLIQYYLLAPSIVGGDKEKAQKIADAAVQDDPAHGWMMQARIALQNKDYAKAESAYLSALKADPQNFAATVALGNFYLQDAVKKYVMTEKYGRDAIRLDPTRAQGYSLVAAQMIYRGNTGADLDAVLAQAEKANPDDWSPYYFAGRVLIAVGKDFDRAERYLRKYLQQEPEGNAPKLAYAHWRLGQMYQKSAKKDLAIAELEACLKAEPNFEPAKKDLKALK